MLNIAVRAARKAGSIINRAALSSGGLQVRAKRANDFVTEVDRAAEAAIIEIVQKSYPDHAILGEESGATHGGAEPGKAEYRWIIDPLDGNVAFVFGNEQAGLTNDEMFACQHLVHIPASAEFSSLNLAQAVQVVAYELFMATNPVVHPGVKQKLATVADREGLYEHLHEAAVKSGFHVPETGSKLPERLRRLFSRVPELEREEVNIVRGLLKALLKRK